MVKSAIISIMLLMIIIPSVSAGSLLVTISQDKPSLNLNHGQSDSVTFTISNDNNICAIQCEYALLKNNNEVVEEGSFSSDAGVSKSFSVTLVAPTKSEVKQESGNIEYVFGVSCSEIKEWWNTCDGEHTQTSNLPLNFDLTAQDKEARDYLKPKLDDMKVILQEFESKEYTLNSKFNSLPKNVLISDLKSQLSGYSSSYLSIKNEYDNINSLFGNLEFISARNLFNLNSISQLNSLKTNLDNLELDIEERLKRHNEVVDKLNTLQEDFNDLKLKSQIANNEVSTLSGEVSSLVSDFEQGAFSSYESIESSISSLSSQISSLKSSIERSFDEILKKGNSLLSKEKVKLNFKTEDSFSSIEGIDMLKDICNSFKSLKQEFEKENQKRTSEYNSEIKRITEYNLQINEFNDKITQVIVIRDDISKIVNNNGIDDFDESLCQNELIKISQMQDYSNLSEDDYKHCIELQNKLIDTKKKKEGFLFNIISFFRSLWFDSVKFEKIKLAEELSSPSEPNLLDMEKESQDFSTKYCSLDLTLEKGSISSVSNVEGDILTDSNVGDVIKNDNLCSVFGVTQKCCENDECKSDVKSYPTIFLHGHAFTSGSDPAYSLDAFNKLQLGLFEDKYRIGGTFLPNQKKSDFVYGEWGKVNFPITVKATYYLNVYNIEGELISEPSKQESISIYAQRLGEIVELVKYRTGRDKVNIVAHSMGGLVAREYIKNGGDFSVNKLIMVGTPNHGIYGDVDSFCSVLGASIECAQMKAEPPSLFIQSLNSGDETYGSVKYYTIAGTGCSLGTGLEADGVVRAESVKLDGATNVKVNGKCEWTTGLIPTQRAFHSNLLDPSKYPQTLEYIKQFLAE